MGLCISAPVEDEPLPKRFQQKELSPNGVCEICKKEGSEIYFTRVEPYDPTYTKRKRRYAIVATTRCGRGHEIIQKIEPSTLERKKVSKQ